MFMRSECFTAYARSGCFRFVFMRSACFRFVFTDWERGVEVHLLVPGEVHPLLLRELLKKLLLLLRHVQLRLLLQELSLHRQLVLGWLQGHLLLLLLLLRLLQQELPLLRVLGLLGVPLLLLLLLHLLPRLLLK